MSDEQNIENNAPNQGAQGTFHGDVNTGTQGTANIAGDNTGQNVGVNYGKVEQHIHPTPQRTPLHQLRAPVADFVGRASEIAELTRALASGNGAAAAICGVRGMGGIGKTELAYVVAHRLADSFPDAQLVVELFGASNPVSPEQALQAVIRAFEPQAKLPDDLPTLIGIYHGCLEQHRQQTGEALLILADDARDKQQVEPLLPPAGCALLTTSRTAFDLPKMQRFDLGVLSEEIAHSS